MAVVVYSMGRDIPSNLEKVEEDKQCYYSCCYNKAVYYDEHPTKGKVPECRHHYWLNNKKPSKK